MKLILVFFFFICFQLSYSEGLQLVNEIPLIEIVQGGKSFYNQGDTNYNYKTYNNYVIELLNSSSEPIYILSKSYKYFNDSISKKGSFLVDNYSQDIIEGVYLKPNEVRKTNIFFNTAYKDSILRYKGIVNGEIVYTYRKSSSYYIDTLKVKFSYKIINNNKLNFYSFSTYNDYGRWSFSIGNKVEYLRGYINNKSSDSIRIDSIQSNTNGQNFKNIYLANEQFEPKIGLPYILEPNNCVSIKSDYIYNKFEKSDLKINYFCTNLTKGIKFDYYDTIYHNFVILKGSLIDNSLNGQTIYRKVNQILTKTGFRFGTLDSNISIVEVKYETEYPKDQNKLSPFNDSLPINLELGKRYTLKGFNFNTNEIGKYKLINKAKFLNKITNVSWYESYLNYIDISPETGVGDVTTQNNFSFYPNPVNEILNIRFDEEIPVNEEITICNIMGQNILSQKIENKETSIKLQNLGTGIYYCKFKQSSSIFKFEVVR
ncbi:MAG: T9SS type A sorting domain-containing protein [Candidatus Kapabacteria bacterium]|nr:T9SS type A sorting domain-containing protein [Candidatus Kapabacteria bacterium]